MCLALYNGMSLYSSNLGICALQYVINVFLLQWNGGKANLRWPRRVILLQLARH